MNISKTFNQISRKFVLIIVGLSVLSVGALSLVLYETNSIRLSGETTTDHLYSVIEDNEAVVDYLEQEKDFEAHFVTIANLVKQDQQRNTTKALLIVTVPVVLIAGAVGYIVAKYLLRPVRESMSRKNDFYRTLLMS